LRQSREEALAFLASLSAKENLHLVDKRVNWLAITTAIESLPPGQRKTAAYGALLLAWKDIPLNLGSSSVRTGVDSPGFFKKVFDSTSLPISQAPGERLSDSMKKQFRKVDQPKIGDLLFYKGAEATSVGNFVMMYLGPGLEGGHGVCLGTFERGQPIQVIDSYYFDQTPPKDMFIGYYEPNYRD
jgi:cell wall-associated NlpC family hydrolase